VPLAYPWNPGAQLRRLLDSRVRGNQAGLLWISPHPNLLPQGEKELIDDGDWAHAVSRCAEFTPELAT
jgi:hypothetical protein